MRFSFVLLCFACLLASCRVFNFVTEGPQAKTTKFKYYQNPFMPTDLISVRTDGMYKKTKMKQEVQFDDYFQFFNTGLVKLYQNKTRGDVVEMEDTFLTSSSYYGFYQVKGDSVFFTLKPFYSKKEEVEGKGRLYDGGMELQLYKKGVATEKKTLEFMKMP